MSSDIGAVIGKSAPIFGCAACLKTFTRRNDLLTHKKEAHHCELVDKTQSLSTKLLDSDPGEPWEDIGSSTPPRLEREGRSPSPRHLSNSARGRNLNGQTSKHSTVTANKSGKWKCKTCFKSLWDLHSYNNHVRLHTGEKPYQCSSCKRRFYSSKSLWGHRHNGGGPKQCQLSKGRGLPRARKQTSDLYAPSDVKVTHDQQNSIDIDSSPEKVAPSLLASRDGQTRSICVPGSLECGQCGKILSRRQALADHIRMHAGTKPYCCSNCTMRYSSKSALITHGKRCLAKNAARKGVTLYHMRNSCRKLNAQRNTLGPATMPVSEISPSPKIQTTKEILMREGLVKPVVTPSKVLKPELMNIFPSTSRNCNTPVLKPKTDNVAEKHWFICQVCGKTLGKPSSLKSHMEIYHKSFDYQPSSPAKLRAEPRSTGTIQGDEFHCPYCPKILTSSLNLKAHICLHTGERPFKCKKCGQGFPNNSAKYKHQNLCLKSKSKHRSTSIHIQSKTIQSQSLRLDYPSKLRARLKKRKQHTPESCPICAKVVIRSSMPAHIRLHIGEKPFACTRCPNKYPSRTSLYTHRRYHCVGAISHKSSPGIVKHDRQTPLVAACSTNFGSQNNIPLTKSDKSEKSHNYEELLVEMSAMAEGVHRRDSATFLNKIDLQQNLKAFECQHCGKVLANADNLNFHIELHSKNLPYKCSHCQLSFHYRKLVDYHNEKAHGDQPQASPLATNGVTRLKEATTVNSSQETPRLRNASQPIKNQQGSKSRKKQIASNSKGRRIPNSQAHICPFCQKILTTAENLESHIRWHTGEVPFVCLTCDKRYPSHTSLIVHERRKH